MVPVPTPASRQIQLPASSTRLQKGEAHCKVLTRVSREANFSLGFEGPIYPPGVKISREDLPERLVVLECCGGIGPLVKRRRETVWILWTWDEAAAEWREIAQASSASWEWAVTLRQPAYEALRAPQRLYDVLQLGRVAAQEIGDLIARKIEDLPEDARATVLASVYDRLAGEIAKYAA